MPLSWYSIWKGAAVWSKREAGARELCQDDGNGADERSLERLTWGGRNADGLALVCQRPWGRSCWGKYHTGLTAQQPVEGWSPYLLFQRPKGHFQEVKEVWEACSGWEWHHLHVPHTLPRKLLLPAAFLLFRGHRACSCRELISCGTCRASGSRMVISFLGPPTQLWVWMLGTLLTGAAMVTHSVAGGSGFSLLQGARHFVAWAWKLWYFLLSPAALRFPFANLFLLCKGGI